MSNSDDFKSPSLTDICFFLAGMFMLLCFVYCGYLVMSYEPVQDQRVIGKWVSSDFDGENASYIFEFSAGGSCIYYQNGTKYLCEWDKSIASNKHVSVRIHISENSTINIILRNEGVFSFSQLSYDHIALYKVTENE